MTIENYIKGSALVIITFGNWPSFHDAEIKQVILGTHEKVEEGYTCETIEITVHCFEMSGQTDNDGYLKLHKHNLITLYFEDINKFELEGLGGQNELLSMEFKVLPPNELGFTYISVELEPAVGLGGYFEAIHAEVLRIEECDKYGKLTKNLKTDVPEERGPTA